MEYKVEDFDGISTSEIEKELAEQEKVRDEATVEIDILQAILERRRANGG